MEYAEQVEKGRATVLRFLERGEDGLAEMARALTSVVCYKAQKEPERVYEYVGFMSSLAPSDRRSEVLRVWEKVRWPEGFEPDWRRIERLVLEATSGQHSFRNIPVSQEEQRGLEQGRVVESLKWRARFAMECAGDSTRRFSVKDLLEIAEGRVPGSQAKVTAAERRNRKTRDRLAAGRAFMQMRGYSDFEEDAEEMLRQELQRLREGG